MSFWRMTEPSKLTIFLIDADGCYGSFSLARLERGAGSSQWTL